MHRYIYSRYGNVIPSLPEHDRRLIEEALGSHWEDIDPGKAQSDIAKEIIKCIETYKYHRDNYCE